MPSGGLEVEKNDPLIYANGREWERDSSSHSRPFA
jgi:hypothetical protein